MDVFTVSFFGHRQIEELFRIEECLEQLIRKLLNEKQHVEFLVGRDGDFDQLVSSTIRRCKRLVRDDNSSLIWVLPYITAEYRENEESFQEYYDFIEICETSAAGHYKNAHQTRNREMVDRSDLVVFYIHHETGGAWQTLKYTRKNNIPFINLNLSEGEQ